MDDDEYDIDDMFHAATHYVRSHGGHMKSEQLLYLYARYKQAKEGACSQPKPGMFDFRAKQKWEAWKKLGNLDPDQAKKEYISLLFDVEPNWMDKKSDSRSSGSSHRSGLGVSVSRMAAEEEDLPDNVKTVFDWCKEGNVEQLDVMLTKTNTNVDTLDDDGLGLLHWACDRGHKNVLEFLLSKNAQVDLQDCDGQTALHYAASCEHVDIVSYLLSRGASTNIPDNDGLLPADTADDSIKRMISQAQH